MVLAPGSFWSKEGGCRGRKIQVFRGKWFVLKHTTKKNLSPCSYKNKQTSNQPSSLLTQNVILFSLVQMLSPVRGEGERESRCQLVSLGRWYTLEWNQHWWIPWRHLKNAISINGGNNSLFFLYLFYSSHLLDHRKENEQLQTFTYTRFSKYLRK